MYDEFDSLHENQEKIDLRIFDFLQGFIGAKTNGRFILVRSEKILQEQRSVINLKKTGVRVLVPCLEEQNVLSIYCLLKKYIPYEDEVLPYLLLISDGQPRILHRFFNVILSHMRKRPLNERRLQKKDLEEILNDTIVGAQDFFYQLRSCLSRDSFWITRLISWQISELTGELEYTLDQLEDIKKKDFPDVSIDWEKGLRHLKSQGWITWKENPQRFSFKFGLFPLWIRRYDIEYE